MKKFNFKICGNQYEVEVLKVEGQIAEIEVNGTRYDVELEKEVRTIKTPTIVRTDVPPPKETKPLASDSNVSMVKAPLPGSILKINVKEGDIVTKGDVLLVMEAMKMENNVMAESDGQIKSIKVKEGDSVLQNDVLVEIQ